MCVVWGLAMTFSRIGHGVNFREESAARASRDGVVHRRTLIHLYAEDGSASKPPLDILFSA